ncbi:hypothetical protein B0I33_10697 [Prauserella shujinwangii]|uniref:Uncharacterized protein n=1 Tax=Prauserella shujinwangii TaxID=1453103 RepID=A0A2T0LTD9_9PSEU|nr:SAV_915 family protein [Prauserella shujinwangii]PRX47000.1 hypothetical protein B0I33_10697 [Prauserella shujinwangii]
MLDTAKSGPARALPPVVYLPCVEHVRNPQDAVVEYRRTNDHRVALLVYSALDRLQSCCGDDQPWVVCPTTMLAPLMQAVPFDLVLLDVVIPDGHRGFAGNTRPRHTTA